jgi:hypothetical protein
MNEYTVGEIIHVVNWIEKEDMPHEKMLKRFGLEC